MNKKVKFPYQHNQQAYKLVNGIKDLETLKKYGLSKSEIKELQSIKKDGKNEIMKVQKDLKEVY